MFRISGRRPPATLDDVTVERLLDGGSIDDLPDALRPLGEVLAAAANAPTARELEGSAATAASFVTARAAAGRVPRRTRSVGLSVFTAVVLVASTGTAVAATQGALPDPMQQVAHDALGVVGVSVPSINDGSDGPGVPVIATDEPSAPPVSPLGTPTTVGGSNPGTATPGAGATTSGTGPSGADPNGNSSDGTPGNSGGQSGENGPPETPPGQVDKPVDPGSGQSGDTTTSPGNSEFDHDQGNGPKDVPPGQVKQG